MNDTPRRSTEFTASRGDCTDMAPRSMVWLVDTGTGRLLRATEDGHGVLEKRKICGEDKKAGEGGDTKARTGLTRRVVGGANVELHVSRDNGWSQLKHCRISPYNQKPIDLQPSKNSRLGSFRAKWRDGVPRGRNCSRLLRGGWFCAGE